ncbi:MAG: hypothetical protein HYR56_01060 [Acidobacteria bacterium]|nr:hypothetical protein [Acidobacteriota bacterium]MBI3426919.1 hypothetical protein [Acidobacteriota bacterium]
MNVLQAAGKPLRPRSACARANRVGTSGLVFISIKLGCGVFCFAASGECEAEKFLAVKELGLPALPGAFDSLPAPENLQRENFFL